ncbi:hypothetical protein B0H34DRAFT_665532 [Crassisporium funariophilum]|nr:hypothetical protein B0H34DRAFT_665532 [Crassisporium funariophilum]
MPPRIPLASYRHAAPSGPWPWADLVEDVAFNPGLPNEKTSFSGNGSHSELWRAYPGLSFPNWNRSRVERSGISKLIHKTPDKTNPGCMIYHIDVGDDGHFSKPGQNLVTDENQDEFWDMIKARRGEGNRVRALFVENLSGSVLQMLGTMYKIEPFFFSSSLNWIPSRYQEDLDITITLTFLRTMPNPMTAQTTPVTGGEFFAQMVSRVGTATIDTQAPLILRSNDRILLVDLLAFHMVRRRNGSTIISYHPTPEWKSTSARYLHNRVRFAGESVYWQSLFRRSSDPTFVLLCLLWYALYAWDESLENLYSHICWLESRVLVTNDIHLTRELHIIRASLLHYASLLESFRKSVLFLRTTPNPAMESHPDVDDSTKLMERECDTLISEIERLEMLRRMQDMRVENVMNLAFSSVNFEDSGDMQRLTEAALRDSAAMKQISYLTMIFLPASFVATAFGMNIDLLQSGSTGTLGHYLAVTVPLTAVTVWIILALHGRGHHGDPETTFLNRLKWPIRSLKRTILWQRNGRTMNAGLGVV